MSKLTTQQVLITQRAEIKELKKKIRDQLKYTDNKVVTDQLIVILSEDLTLVS
tara:strand:- start:1211 stop:1369 length:159 start_codon:yes stop_codon:yes gene_type:complete